MPGFEKIRFTRENFHEDLICKYCFNVIQNPQTCQTCQLNFCKDCADLIQKEQSKQENILKQEKSNECVHLFKESSKYLINKVDKLELKCRYWFMGCEYIDLVENMVKHQEICKKKMKNFDTNKDLLIKCPKGCQKLCSIDELQRNQHDCIKYLKEQIFYNDREYQSLRTNITQRLDEIQERMAILQQNEEKMQLEQIKNEKLKITFQKLNQQQQMLLKEYNDCGLQRLEELIKYIQNQTLQNVQEKIKYSEREVEQLNQQIQNIYFEEMQYISQEYNQFKSSFNKEISKILEN